MGRQSLARHRFGSNEQLKPLIRNSLRNTKPKRRRRMGLASHALPAHCYVNVKHYFEDLAFFFFACFFSSFFSYIEAAGVVGTVGNSERW